MAKLDRVRSLGNKVDQLAGRGRPGGKMNETVQFYLSRVAADAVDVDRLEFRARERGLSDATAKTSYYRTGGRCRVTRRRASQCCRAADWRIDLAFRNCSV